MSGPLLMSGPVDCGIHHNLYPDTQENPSNVCFNIGATIGLAFQAEAGLVSLIALLTLLGAIFYNYQLNLSKPPPGPWRLLRGNMDILMLNLIFADILMSIGSIPNIYWAHKQQVYLGPMCTFQGAIQTIGETAVAFANILVTLYTFTVVYFDRRFTCRPWICLGVIASTWLWVLLWGVIPIGTYSGLEPDEHGSQAYYSPTPWWCWINGRYKTDRIVVEYLWLWIAGVGSICFYVPSYILIRRSSKEENGTIRSVPEDRPAGETLSLTDSIEGINNEGHPARILCYPITYTICILPLSVMRWATFSDSSLLSNPYMNPPSMIFGTTFYLMGLINVMLTVWVRPGILLIGSDGQLGSDDPRFISETRCQYSNTIRLQRMSQSDANRFAPNTAVPWST